MIDTFIPSRTVSKTLLIVNAVVALIYFAWWFMPGRVGNPWLFYSLLFGEFYHIIMAGLFWFTLWPHEPPQIQTQEIETFPSVAVFITVAGEPVDLVRTTAIAARDMNYPNHKVYILNDGYVANRDNWQEIEEMAHEIGVECITRRVGGGAKAGNINNALRHTESDLIAIFDADMVPDRSFLEQTVPYLTDKEVAFVQTPQFYKNSAINSISGGAWEQQELFFGPIMEGKGRVNAAFICGTNVVIRKQALLSAGGMYEKNIAEDFLTSLFIHQKGWKSFYLNKVLAKGLAPEDLLSYYNQQLRWARGSLEVLFGHNPLFQRRLTLVQKIQYLASALYYFNGVIIVIDMVMPLISLFFGPKPVSATTTSFAFFFIPFMFLNLYTLFYVSKMNVTFRAISFAQSSWTLQLLAVTAVLFKRQMKFKVTSKQALNGNYLSLALPHILYGVLVAVAAVVGILREGFSPSVATNVTWGLFNLALFFPFINASFQWRTLLPKYRAEKRLHDQSLHLESAV